jgi:hypothetical protein
MKLTTRCGPAAVQGCNEALLVKAAEAKLLRTSRLRADTTVVAANVAYPTDSGLLAKAIRRIAAAGTLLPGAGGAGCGERSMTWPGCWRSPTASPPRPGSGWPAPCRRGRPGG